MLLGDHQAISSCSSDATRGVPHRSEITQMRQSRPGRCTWTNTGWAISEMWIPSYSLGSLARATVGGLALSYMADRKIPDVWIPTPIGRAPAE